MRIHGSPHALGFVASLAAPTLPVADKESLIGREIVEGLQGLGLRVFLPRQVCEDQSPKIGDVLTQRQRAVDLNVVDDGVRRILIRNARSALFKFLRILRSPPIAQIPLS